MMKKPLQRGLAVLIGLVFALALGELLSFFLFSRRIQEKLAYRTDSSGFRMAAHPLTKPPSAYRIAFIGDSYTFGQGVEEPRIFSERTRALLQEDVPDRKIEALNFGRPGLNAIRECLILKEDALAYDPDVVVLGFVLNDFSVKDTTVRFEREAKRLKMKFSPFLALEKRSRLAAFLDWGIVQLFSGTGRMHLDYLNGLFDPRQNRHYPEALAALDEMIRIMARHGGVVLFFPYLMRDEENALFYRAGRKIVAGLCRDHGVAFLEILPLLKGHPFHKWWVSPMNHHPNGDAHDLIARALAEEVRKKIAFGKPGPPPDGEDGPAARRGSE